MSLHRSPKPELLRLLLDHLPPAARNGTRQHHDGSNGMRKAGGLANGSAGAEAHSKQVLAAQLCPTIYAVQSQKCRGT